MIIGIDATRANRAQKTGTEWYSYFLIRWFAKLDSENQYILYTDTPLVDGLCDLTTKQFEDTCKNNISFDNDGFQIIKSPYNNFRAKVLKWPFNFFWTQGRLAIEMFFNKPDILFIPSHTLPFIHPKKSVVTIHDVGFAREHRLYDQIIMGPKNLKARKFLNFLIKLFTWGHYGANSMDYQKWSTKYALKHAEKIITVSSFTKQEIDDIYNVDKNKIKIIYNGYNKFLYQKIIDNDKINTVINKYGIEKPYVLYVGRLERKKNTPALIEAFGLLREKYKTLNFKLVLIGNASYGYDEVNYTIREFGLEHDVIMPGWVDEADMPYLYNGASLFIFPSKYEGFGIPLLEAMACGLPITASWESSIPEVVGEDAAYLFNPNSIHSITEAMHKVLSDENFSQKIINQGYERVKNFSWEKSAKETLELLKSI